MGGERDTGIGTGAGEGRVLEFADINIERCAAQMIALERVGEGLLVDDLTPGDVDEHAPRLHRSKAILVEETGRLRCPLERLVDTFENLHDFDMGLGTPVTFGRSEHQGVHKVWGTELDASGHYQPIDLQ